MDISADWKSHLLVEYSKNHFACKIMDGQIQDDRYRVIDDVIFYKDRVYFVPNLGLKKKILTANHDSPLAGHQGFFQNLQANQREVLMEGHQTGCYVIHQ
jgi:uracil DNA glycosylase